MGFRAHARPKSSASACLAVETLAALFRGSRHMELPSPCNCCGAPAGPGASGHGIACRAGRRIPMSRCTGCPRGRVCPECAPRRGAANSTISLSHSMASPSPRSRHNSPADSPAWCSFNIPMLCASVNLPLRGEQSAHPYPRSLFKGSGPLIRSLPWLSLRCSLKSVSIHLQQRTH